MLHTPPTPRWSPWYSAVPMWPAPTRCTAPPPSWRPRAGGWPPPSTAAFSTPTALSLECSWPMGCSVPWTWPTIPCWASRPTGGCSLTRASPPSPPPGRVLTVCSGCSPSPASTPTAITIIWTSCTCIIRTSPPRSPAAGPAYPPSCGLWTANRWEWTAPSLWRWCLSPTPFRTRPSSTAFFPRAAICSTQRIGITPSCSPPCGSWSRARRYP